MKFKIFGFQKISNFFNPKSEKQEFYWEYYNRILSAVQKLKALNLDGANILDVGGATGDNLLKKFGLKKVATLDIGEGADIRASADKIPSKDNSFEVVTCIDTLEHTPSDLREKVINELVRVASQAVIIISPINSKENVKAEKIVLKYIQEDFLEEHKKYGLVNFKDIVEYLKKSKHKNKIEKIYQEDIDNLLTWVIMMTHGYVNISQLYKEVHFLENKFFPRRRMLSVILKKE